MTDHPIPIAVRLDNDLTLRGHEWSVDGPAVVFVHDLGHDLDAWGSVTAQIAAKGFRVISIELRGHGLSDGEPDPTTVVEDMRLLLAEIVPSFGPVALVSYGSASEALFSLDESHGAPVQVVISPQQLTPGGIDWSTSSKALRLVIGGSLDERAHGYLNAIYPKMLGEKLWVSVATAEVGPSLLHDQASAVEQLIIFLRRYLPPYHLAWIKQHEKALRAAAQARSDAEPDPS